MATPLCKSSVMRKIAFLLLLAYAMPLLSYELPGYIWQADLDEVAAGYLDRYEFGDSTFVYYSSEFENISLVTGLMGSYEISSDSILLTAEALLYHRPDGYETSFMFTSNGGWEYFSHSQKVDTINVEFHTVRLPFVVNANSIEIDRRIFYRVSE